MVIPAQSILVYLEGMESVSVRKTDLSPGYEASKAEAVMLVASGCVEGRGSRARLKFLRLLCTPEEAESKALNEAARLANTSKRKIKMLALDVLQRMSADRKFIYREKLPGLDGKWSGHWTFTHKQPVAGFGVRWAQ